MRAPQQLSALQVEGPEPLWTRGGGALRLLHGASGQQGGHGRRGQVRTLILTVKQNKVSCNALLSG